MLPRDAFFGPVEQVPVAQAVGRVTAEMVSPEGTTAPRRPPVDAPLLAASCAQVAG